MRQVWVRVPEGGGDAVMDIAGEHGGLVISRLAGSAPDGPIELVMVNVPNESVGPLLGRLGDLPDVAASFIPSGALVLRPPAGEAPEEVRDVGARSPLEIFLAGLQSVGSWRGFLSYAAAAGAVVWLGLVTNTTYLLVAAMLLAPFASPAINAAIGTARGDLRLIARSVGRYAAAIGLTVVVCAVLSVVFDLRVESQLMADTANISALTFILPLVAGVAGGLYLVQGERSSLVSGAAVGILVAASLAPPAGVAGMAAVIGQWEMVASGAFLIALQLVGINLAAALIFRMYGVDPQGTRYPRGRPRLVWIASGAAAVGFGALLVVQFATGPPFLQRSSLEQDARAIVVEGLQEVPEVELANAEVSFTRAEIPGQNTLLIVLHVQPGEGAADLDETQLAGFVTGWVQDRLASAGMNVTPLVDVTVVRPPGD